MSIKEQQDPCSTHNETVGGGSYSDVDLEDNLPFFRAVRKFWRSYFWAAFYSLGLVCGGFDFQITGSIIAVSAFREQFGEAFEGDFVIPAPWLAGFNTISYGGGFISALVCGWFSDRYGRKWAVAVGVSFLTLGAVLQVVAMSRSVFLIAKLVFGFGMGFNIAVTPMVVGEVIPVCLRGPTTAGLNLALLAGQLLSNAVLRGFGANSERLGLWAYRAPLLFQILIPSFLLPALFFAPESPWYLARQGKLELATNSLQRLYGDSHIHRRLQDILETIRQENSETSVSYKSCFQGANKRRTMISVGVFVCQHLSGVAFVLSYSTYFFELAGLQPEKALDMGIGVTACGFAGSLLSIYFLSSVSRRRSYLVGYGTIVGILMAIGALDFANASATKWIQSALTVVYGFIYNATIGSLSYVILVENSSPALRSKTASLASATQNCFFVIMHFAIPYMVNPNEGDLKGKVGFVFGGASSILFIWAFFCIPDLRNKSFADIEYLYENGISSRKMGRTVLHSEPGDN